MKNYLSAIFAGFGSAIAIGLIAYLDASFKDTLLIMAPFGASAVLVFGLPDSPLAQPKNVVFGHLLTAAIGVFFVQYIGTSPFSLAIATGLGVSAMMLTKTTHPPAGANPLLIILTGQSWFFLITPVLIGAVIIVLVGKIMQYLKARFI
jgi:CBS-domain-containing membrane protein